MGCGVIFLSASLIDHSELVGLQQTWAYFKKREFHRPPFKTPSLYRIVRHPLYLGFMIAFWSAPVMTAGHLLFSTATTGYILAGIYFEERDLVRVYGERYRLYRRRVPMLLPWTKRPQKHEQAKRQAA
jgi:steroid 5-alpha reductase family enzyme